MCVINCHNFWPEWGLDCGLGESYVASVLPSSVCHQLSLVAELVVKCAQGVHMFIDFCTGDTKCSTVLVQFWYTFGNLTLLVQGLNAQCFVVWWCKVRNSKMFSKEGTCETNRCFWRWRLVQFPSLSLNEIILSLVGMCGQYCVCECSFHRWCWS